MDYTYDELVKNIQNAYCDSSQAQVSGFSPAFVYNNPEIEQNVLTAIESCLKDCDEFMFSVAFIIDRFIIVTASFVTACSSAFGANRIT